MTNLGAAFVLAVAVASNAFNAGDRVRVDVAGEAELSQTVTVAGDGTIALPLAGTLAIGGSSPAAASATIASALRRFVRDPRVTVERVTEGTIAVLVLGAVAQSGSYALRPGAHLSEAIAAAGGMDPAIDGAYPVARIALADGTTYHLSLEKILRGGDATRDIALTQAAAIYVPSPQTFAITIIGAVDRPGTLSLRDGDRLSIAIAKAGDTPATHADLRHIVVTRTGADGRAVAHEVDLYAALEHGDLRFDPPLHPGDVVDVPSGSTAPGALVDALALLTHLLFL
jgi:polysaccharide export outer membrane protein